LITQYVPSLAVGDAPRIKQDHAQATVVPQRKPEDGLINWPALSARQAYDWIRAQTRPYPGAFTFLGQEKVTIWKAGLIESAILDSYQAGTIVLDHPEHLAVCCADRTALLIKEVGLADGSSMTGTEFRRLRSLRPGVKFDVERNPLHLAHA